MSEQTQKAPPRLNTLIPMEDADGNRCFVNQWDVTARIQDGWKVVGKLEQHTSTTKAPIEHLDDGKGGAGKPKAKTGGKSGSKSGGADDDTDPGAGGAGGDPTAK